MQFSKVYKKGIKNLIIIFVGNLLLAFSMSFCLINYKGEYIYGFDTQTHEVLSIKFNGILGGGTSGLSLILRNLFFLNVSNSEMLIENIVTITTIFLFLLGAIFLGKRFAFQTLLSTILCPIFLYIFKLNCFDFLHDEFTLFDPIVCSVIGGLLMGVDVELYIKLVVLQEALMCLV